MKSTSLVAVLCDESDSISAVERPSNVTARLGDDVDLKCAITGGGATLPKVQWARGDVMLGHERHIPGHARYSMFGEISQGEYHLRIKNVCYSYIMH